MSNLVPELRVNKNGVAVIKHVRPIAKGSSAGKAMPSPSLKPTLDSAVKENKIRSILSGIKVHNGAARARMEERLWGMNPEQFDRIETLSQGNDEVDSWEASHRWLVKQIIDDPSEENRELYLNALDAFDDDYQEWADVRTLRSLRKIPEFIPYAEDFRKAPVNVLEGALRLGNYRNELTGFSNLYYNTDTNTRLRSRRLEALIINEPERAQLLLDWTTKHLDKDLTAIDSDLALRVIDNPHERSGIAAMLVAKVDTKVIGLVLDRVDRVEEIINLYDNGVTRVDAIKDVLDGNVEPAFASGIL